MLEDVEHILKTVGQTNETRESAFNVTTTCNFFFKVWYLDLVQINKPYLVKSKATVCSKTFFIRNDSIWKGVLKMYNVSYNFSSVKTFYIKVF